MYLTKSTYHLSQYFSHQEISQQMYLISLDPSTASSFHTLPDVTYFHVACRTPYGHLYYAQEGQLTSPVLFLPNLKVDLKLKCVFLTLLR